MTRYERNLARRLIDRRVRELVRARPLPRDRNAHVELHSDGAGSGPALDRVVLHSPSRQLLAYEAAAADYYGPLDRDWS